MLETYTPIDVEFPELKDDKDTLHKKAQRLADEAFILMQNIFKIDELKPGEFVALRNTAKDMLTELSSQYNGLSISAWTDFSQQLDYEVASRFMEDYYGINFRTAWLYFQNPKVRHDESREYFQRIREKRELI